MTISKVKEAQSVKEDKPIEVVPPGTVPKKGQVVAPRPETIRGYQQAMKSAEEEYKEKLRHLGIKVTWPNVLECEHCGHQWDYPPKQPKKGLLPLPNDLDLYCPKEEKEAIAKMIPILQARFSDLGKRKIATGGMWMN